MEIRCKYEYDTMQYSISTILEVLKCKLMVIVVVKMNVKK